MRVILCLQYSPFGSPPSYLNENERQQNENECKLNRVAFRPVKRPRPHSFQSAADGGDDMVRGADRSSLDIDMHAARRRAFGGQNQHSTPLLDLVFCILAAIPRFLQPFREPKPGTWLPGIVPSAAFGRTSI